MEEEKERRRWSNIVGGGEWRRIPVAFMRKKGSGFALGTMQPCGDSTMSASVNWALEKGERERDEQGGRRRRKRVTPCKKTHRLNSIWMKEKE